VVSCVSSGPTAEPTPEATASPVTDSSPEPDAIAPDAESNDSQPSSPESETANPQADAGNTADPVGSMDASFDPNAVEVGDRISGLTLTALEVNFYGENNEFFFGSAEFEGEAIVTGEYQPDYLFPGSTDGYPCFFLSADSAPLPRFDFDERIPWFCFENPDAVETALGSQPMMTTLRIDRVRIEYAASDVANSARFVDVAPP
jgi:hypothetical protein